MEEGKSACKQWKKKKKTTVSTGGFHGGGIGGVVTFGGALAAAAALIAFLANRRNKGRRPTKKDQSIDSDSSKNSTLKNKKNPDEESEGLQLLVHPSPPPPSVHLNPHCKSNGTPEMGSAGPNDLISTQNSILEEISVLKINGGKETLKNGNRDESLLSDITNPENISLCKDSGVGNEEYTLQVLEISSVLEEEANKINVAGEEEPPSVEAIEEAKREEEASSEISIAEQLDEDDVNKINDAGEEPPLLEAIEEAKKNEGASSEISIAEQVEENPPMKSVEEEEKEEKSVEEEEKEEDADLDDDDDESEEEKSEDSSEETVDSSMESNAEAIWPTESIEKLSLALKEMNNNYQISGEKIGEEDGTVQNDGSSKDGSFYEYGKEDKSTRKSLVISDDKEAIKLLTVKDHPMKSGKLRMLILSILGTVLLLLMLGFFTHHEALFSYLVNGDSIL